VSVENNVTKRKKEKKGDFFMKKYEQPLLFLIETSEQDVLAASAFGKVDYKLSWLEE
jgi:hypothetical protein